MVALGGGQGEWGELASCPELRFHGAHCQHGLPPLGPGRLPSLETLDAAGAGCPPPVSQLLQEQPAIWPPDTQAAAPGLVPPVGGLLRTLSCPCVPRQLSAWPSRAPGLSCQPPGALAAEASAGAVVSPAEGSLGCPGRETEATEPANGLCTCGEAAAERGPLPGLLTRHS